MSKVAIIGVGQSTFVRSYPGSIRELVFEGFKDAMQDAQLTPKDIDASVVCSAPEYDKQRSPAGVFAEYLGLNPQPTFYVETLCSSSSTGLKLAYSLVKSGLHDAVAVIDVERREKVATIDLGGPGEITLARKGERIFHSAEVTYGRQFSCHSCHPDGGIDNITYDIEPDGIGGNPVDNRTLRGILDTAPFKWEGTNPSLARQCGPRLAVFFTRVEPFTPEELAAVDRYIRTIPRPPNRYRPVGALLTDAQRRGKQMFEREMTNSGVNISVGTPIWL